MTRRIDSLVALTLAIALAGCGSTPAQPEYPPPLPPQEFVAPEEPAPATPPNPWAALDTEALSRIVTEGAIAQIREADSTLDLAQLPAWRQSPASAPELGGRVVDRLLDLAVAAFASGRFDEARQTVELVRARARNRNSAWAGNTLLCVTARKAADASPVDAQRAAVAAVFRALPASRLGSASVIYLMYQEESQIQAQLDDLRTQLVSMETASDALFYGAVLREVVAHRDLYLAAIDTVRRENDARPARRDYRFSTVDLTRQRGAEVRMGVWDVGTNPELFRAQLFTSPSEQPNGRDDDGNGQIDDIHGIASDGAAPNGALLFDPGAEVITQYGPFLRGVMDLRAGMASTPSAQRVLELLRSVRGAEALETLERNLDAVGEWAHGTHVAGIMLAGNPHARLAIFRSAWAGETRTYYRRGPTDAELDAERQNIAAIAEFIRRHRIRVVNASLGFGMDYVESQLRFETRTYTTPEAVRERARAIQARRRAHWQWIFEQCPDTLFVVAAGNENRDVVEFEDVPAALSLPNLLVVGAVDRYGDWATFTNSSPDRVRIFDHGVEVDSLVPSGERVPLSGTSMASPNVANLAGKILSANPSLTPQQVISIIVETAT
ncbi:MAG: S8 family serine peptidase, partial [Deltaproteobacteria bacterium]|nr:S8 family serine peptidase [Deltaproteobacteria bacterium]